MLTTRTAPRLLHTRRLNPDYYAPVHIQDEARLRSLGCFDLADCGRFFAGPFGSELPGSVYRPSGVPLLRVGNVGSLDLIESNLVFLDEQTHEKLSASEVIPGDLLIVKASVGEKVCRFPSRFARGNITQHIIGVRPNGSVDMDYVAAVLFSPVGRRQLARRSLGSIIQYLGVVDARTVLIPLLDPSAQCYIGEKVRQAGRLRARAAAAKATANQIFEGALRWDSVLATPLRSRLISAVTIGKRLDANFNSPSRARLADHLLSQRITTDEIDELVEVSAMIGWKGLTTENYVDVGPWLLRGVEIDDGVIHFDDLVCVEQRKYDEQPQIHLKEGDVAMTKDGTIGKAIVIPHLPRQIAAGSTVARLRTKERSGLSPYYLEHVINHGVGQIQIASFATGMAQPHITQEWIAQIQIPRLPVEGEVAHRVRQHHELMVFAGALVRAAVLLVDLLLQGAVDGATLSRAHAALEAGDRSLDRTLLQSLRRGEGDGALPLFPDLDALYALLAETDRN